MIYEPREDSYLLQKEVEKNSFGDILDIGCGSGIQSFTAIKLSKVTTVLGVDVDKEAIDYCRKELQKFLKKPGNKKFKQKIVFYKSDLFSKIPKIKFDTIIFNPPYLPLEKREPKKSRIVTTGGKKGFELIERFLEEVNEYLNTNGIILLLFSSLTDKKIYQFIMNNLFESELLSTMKLDFETLYVYKIKKTKTLKLLEKRNISKIKKLTKGHRGLIFTGILNGSIKNKTYKNHKITVKIQRKDIAAKGTVNNESNQLRVLNKYNIGPKLLFSGNSFFVYEYVKGKMILDFLGTATRKQVIDVIKNIYNQMYTMDKLKRNKQEMHHPLKHVIIDNQGKNVVLVDFERCRKAKQGKIHNVTQFTQFVISGFLENILRKNKIVIDRQKLLNSARKYSQKPSKKSFEMIVGEIG